MIRGLHHCLVTTLFADLLNGLAANLRLADFLDVAVVSVLLYFALRWGLQRASRAMVVGVASIAALYVVARLFDMYLTLTLFQIGFTVILLVLVLVFQEDVRRAFERMAAWKPRIRGLAASSTAEIDTLIETISVLARERIGALLVFRGGESLERHIRGGLPVDGQVSLPLLLSIFHPASPGHDGAVVIHGGRIEMLGCHLPLSTNLDKVGSRGLRHTAAVGLAERCDALVVIVSEERGSISVAEQGRLTELKTAAELHAHLRRQQQLVTRAPRITKWPRWTRRDIGLKAASVFLAVLFWLLIAYRVETVQRTYIVPIELRNMPKNLTLVENYQTQARVTFSGSEREFDHLDPSVLLLSVDLSNIDEGEHDVPLRADQLRNPPPGLSVSQIDPLSVYVRVEREGQPKSPP